jgi:hypothetical protein
MARFTTAGGSGDGTPGAPGAPGADGADGASAYDIAVENGFEGTEQEWLDSLVGGGSGADTGDITFVESTMSNDTGDDIVIQNKNSSGIVKARMALDQSNGQVLLEAFEIDSESFDDTQWSTAVWSGTTVTITNTPDIISFFNNTPGDITGVRLNSGVTHVYGGASYGSDNITIDIDGMPGVEEDPLTVTQIRFYYSISSKIDIDFDNGSFDMVAGGNMDINITSGDDLTIYAGGDDLRLRASDDITFAAGYDNEDQSFWRMNYTTGRFELPSLGYIENPASSSGDGNSYDTIKIVPDIDREEFDQYLIIDPTVPNHIHIRAGGEQDASNADLILGAEDTHVMVSDNNNSVSIRSASAGQELLILNEATEPSLGVVTYYVGTLPSIGDTVNVEGTEYTVTEIDYSTGVDGQQIIYCDDLVFAPQTSYLFVGQPSFASWGFESNGVLSGPEMNNLVVYGITNPSSDSTLNVFGKDSVTISGENGEFLGDPENANNQIATIGDISNAVTAETSFTVNGGTIDGTPPAFNGDPLFSGTYVKTGPLVHFQIQVDMDNITSFGTGQYAVTLPFPAKYGYQVREGCLHDFSTGRQYAIGGHVAAGQSTLNLFYTDSNGQDADFDHNSPIILTTDDNFHISGTYIIN